MYKIKYNATFASTLMITIKKKDRNNVRFQELTSCTEGSVITPIPVPLKLHHNFSTNTGLFVCCFFFFTDIFCPSSTSGRTRRRCLLLSCFCPFLCTFYFPPQIQFGPCGYPSECWSQTGCSWESPWVL